MTRLYSKDRHVIECRYTHNNRLCGIFRFIKYDTIAFPRYDFANFSLDITQYNYEIQRFISFVNKVLSNPSCFDTLVLNEPYLFD